MTSGTKPISKIVTLQKRDQHHHEQIAQKSLVSEVSKIQTAIIEDEESFRSVLMNVLQSTGRFSVTPFESGEEAVREFANTHFDLVILDHKLHGMSGLNVLQWIHEQKLEVPVIMLTGAGNEKIAVEAMKLGAYDYLRKDQFDRQHFPIVAAGVFERYLFRKEKQELSRQHNRNLVSLEALSQSISAMALTMNSTLTTISTITDDCLDLAQHLSDKDKTQQLQGFVGEIQAEYTTVVTITKSIAEISRLIIDRVAGIVKTTHSEKEMFVENELPRSMPTPPDNVGTSSR